MTADKLARRNTGAERAKVTKDSMLSSSPLLKRLGDRVIAEAMAGAPISGITKEDALEVLKSIQQPEDIVELSLIAFRVNKLNQLAANNGEIGFHQCGSTYYIQKPCTQGCAFCVLATDPKGWNPPPQRFSTPEEFKQEALEAERNGATHYKIVTLKQRLTRREFELILEAYRQIRESSGLTLCGSFGAYLAKEEIQQLKAVGVTQINCNIECSRSYAPVLFGLKDLDNPNSKQWRVKHERLVKIGKRREESTHLRTMSDGSRHTFRMFEEEAYDLWDAKYNLIKIAIGQEMNVCCGGIVGAGENDGQRVELFYTLKELGVHTSPFNVFVPQPGTPLEDLAPIGPLEIVKNLALLRLISPTQKIMYNAGVQYMGSLLPLALLTGVSGLGSGSYLNKDIGNQIAETCRLVGLDFAGNKQREDV